jgi:isocitrate dehydrogenase kinase/phosphatase
MRHHADLLDVAFWQAHKDRIQAGHVHDVFPYEPARRFAVQRLAAAGWHDSGPSTALGRRAAS